MVGCDGVPEVKGTREVGLINNRKFYVTTVNDGYGNHHYVYFTKDDAPQPVTVNFRAGKASQVVVMVDGIVVSSNMLEMPVK
jgi:hypothetical protein